MWTSPKNQKMWRENAINFKCLRHIQPRWQQIERQATLLGKGILNAHDDSMMSAQTTQQKKTIPAYQADSKDKPTESWPSRVKFGTNWPICHTCKQNRDHDGYKEMGNDSNVNILLFYSKVGMQVKQGRDKFPAASTPNRKVHEETIFSPLETRAISPKLQVHALALY